MSARVKSVLSGDTIILKQQDRPELTLNLAYVTANRMTEPIGFEAREFLRKLALGKPIKYTVLYEANGRTFGDVSAPIFDSLIEYMLVHGYVKLRNDAPNQPEYAKYGDALVKAQSTAESKEIGCWNQKPQKQLQIRGDVPESLYGSGRKVPAIVEKVVSGDRVMLRAMMDSDDHYLGPAILAGIKSRRSDIGDPIGVAAAEFLSARMLQKSEVRAIFHAPSPFNAELPLVTLTHPMGDIAQSLVADGLCETVNTPQIGSERLLLLKNTQMDAEKRGAGIFRAASEAKEAHRAQFASKASEATIFRIVSSDTYVLSDGRTVQLSSTRAPRKVEDPEGLYVQAAREFARKLLIGKTVRVQVDGESNFQDRETRALVTMSYGPNFASNAALDIISNGWATALRHRRDDLSRSPFYDELMAAEEKAKSENLGVHNDKLFKGKNKKMVDASESLVRAKGYLPSLERRSKMPGVVDHVISSGRLRIIIPSENCSITAVLAGVRVPRQGEPLSEEALAYTMSEWNQREIQVTVNGTDKTGAFTTIIYNKGKTLNEQLVAKGFASVHAGSANGAGIRNELEDLQDAAKESKLGIWENYEEPQEPLTTGQVPVSEVQQLTVGGGGGNVEAATLPAPISVPAILSHVSAENVYVRPVTNDAEYKRMNTEITSFFTAASNQAARAFTRKPRRQEQVVVLPDHERAIIEAIDRNSNGYDVLCVDTGARLNVKYQDLLPLPQQFTKTKPLAVEVRLQFVHRPVGMYENAYVEYLSTFKNKAIRFLAPGMLFLTENDDIKESVNMKLIAGAYASVPIAEASLDSAKPFLSAQNVVKESRQGMWEYGDPREDEDM